MRIERRKKSKQQEQEKNTKTLSLKSLSDWVDFETWRGFDLWNVSWSEVFCSCNECGVQKTWMPLKEVVGGIYSLQPLPSRWLNLLLMGTPDSLVPHQTCFDFSALTSITHCSLLADDRWCRLSLLRWLTGHVWCTPDSSVNYRGAPLGNSREWAVRVLFGLVHQTLSGAPLAAHSQVLCSKFIWVPNWISFLVCVEPYAPKINDILAN
jgi:hypothetical protein